MSDTVLRIDRTNAQEIDSLGDCHVSWVPSKTFEEGKLRAWKLVVNSYWSDRQGRVGDYVVIDEGRSLVRRKDDLETLPPTP